MLARSTQLAHQRRVPVVLTIAELAARSLAAYDELAALGEEVEDEWTYVTDLVASWHERIEALMAGRAEEPVEAAVEAAVDRLIEEVGLIRDPHRAIDWLSTFPQVMLLSLGEQP